jgi:hypothetical protein
MITDDLFKKLNDIIEEKIYPVGINPVPRDRIMGKAFFPGGDGLLDEQKTFPDRGIMILGQDFDNECNFIKSLKKGHEENSKTWYYLEKILGVETMRNCFFTNAIMGLREGDTRNTGRSKAFNKKNKIFLDKCRQFFIEQVRYQKPKLIIGLGAHIPKFLSETSNNLKHLSEITSLLKLGNNIEKNIFNNIDGYETKVIFVTHPSMYHLNVDKRLDADGKKMYAKGIEFENLLIKTALQ